MAFGTQKNLEVSEKGLLRQLGKAKNKITVYHSDTAFVAEEEVFERRSVLHNSAAFGEDLTVQRRKYFAYENLVGEILILDVVEKVKKLFVVSFEQGKN